MTALALLQSPLAREGHPDKITSRVNAAGGYRLTLSYAWERDRPFLPWIMQNPAEAGTKREFDMTAHRVIRWSYRWGFGGCLLLNLIPYVAPRLADVRQWLRWDERQDWHARDMLHENWRRLRDELEPYDAAMVAWGASLANAGGQLDAYEFDVMVEQAFDSINDPDGERTAVLKTFCLGTTGGGHPLHPMARGRHRVPDAIAPRPFTGSLGSIVGLGEEASTS